jgi:WD40 repeat protein/serine/threonine protein kinase
MSANPNNLAEQNLIFAGLGLQLGIFSKDKVIRAFTEWLFDKSIPLGQIMVQQKAISQEQRNSLESAVKAHIQQGEGNQDKALASLHMVKDLESDLDHLADKDLMETLGVAITKRKILGLDQHFTQTYGSEVKGKDENFNFEGVPSAESDRFERKQFLDSGNLGEVYFAKDLELNRLVVAKYIKPERSGERLTQALFHLEGEVTGALEHPNIVPVYGLGKDSKGRLYYAMRYIRGRKFTRVIAEYHQIPKSESSKKHEALIGMLQYFQSACLAIEYAHSKGVLHCDIKPDNIMIGDYGEVFVVDWGLVVVCGEVMSSSDMQMIETMDRLKMPPYRPSELASSGLHEQQGGSRKGVGGTPAYMAPEQFKATMEEDISMVTPSSDIYALGATLYHLLTGRAPHLPKSESKESPDAFFFRITTGMIPKPKEINFDIPNSLEGITRKAMEVNPKDRYGSARELEGDIKRWVADEPVTAYEENVLERSSRFARKNRALLISVSILLVFLAVGGIGYGTITQGFNQQLRLSEQSAKENARIAIEEKEKALRNENLANEEKLKATASEKLAQQQKEQANQQLNINRIQTAYTEWLYGDAKVTQEQLESIPIGQRGWEHGFLTKLSKAGQVILDGHLGEVPCVAFSRGAERFITGSTDKTIKVWDAKNGREIHSLKGHSEKINSLDISHDGKKVVSCGGDRKIKVWDATTGGEICTLTESEAEIHSVFLNKDGSKMVSGGADGKVTLWDLDTRKIIKIFESHEGDVFSVSFSSDEQKIISAGSDKFVRIWDVTTGKQTLSFKALDGIIYSACLSPDGSKILTAGYDLLVRVWDATNGVEIYSLVGHTDTVSCARFSHDGKKIVSAGWDKNIKLWDVSTGKEIRNLKGHSESVSCISLSPDCRRIISGSNDKTARVWNLEITEGVLTFQGHEDSVTSVAFSPDGKQIAGGNGDKTIKIWDIQTNRELLCLRGHEESVECVAYSPDGRKIASGSSDNTIRIWDAKTGREIRILKGHELTVASLAFNPDGRKIVSAGWDNKIKIWDSERGREIINIDGHNDCVTTVTISPNGQQIASGSRDKTVKVWDSESGRNILILEGHTDYVTSVSFSPNGRQIATGSLDNSVKVWDLASGVELQTLFGHSAGVHSLVYSMDGRRIASGCVDGTVKLWDATNGFEIITLKDNTDMIFSLAFSRDGKKLASGSADTTLKLWEYEDENETMIFKSKVGIIEKVVFMNDGKYIICRNEKNKKQLWNLESNATTYPYEPNDKDDPFLKGSNITSDNQWSVKPDGNKVILKNTKLQEERSRKDRKRLEQWSSPDPKWNELQAAESEANEDWFGAVFHLEKILSLNPENKDVKTRIATAKDRLKAK